MLKKVKEKFAKTRHVKNYDKFKKHILRGQKKARYHDRIPSRKKKFYNFTTK